MPTQERDKRRGPRAKWQSLSFEAKVTAFVAPLLVFAVTFTVERILNDGGSGESAVTSGQSAPRGGLEVIDVRPSESDRSGAVEFVVRNTGGTVSVITEAEFEVRDVLGPSGLPTACGTDTSASAIDLSGSYDVAIPSEGLFQPEGATGSVIVAVNQEIAPDEADRFSFDVGVGGTQGDRASASKPALYLIDIAIRHDGDNVLRAGSVLLGIPLRDPGCASPWTDEDIEELRRKARRAEKSPELSELVSGLLG